MKRIVPLYDRIVVRRKSADDVTEGGIYIPENAKEKPLEGEVLAVGRGRVLDSGKLVEPSVRQGDTVLFTKYSGTEVKHNNDDVLIIREDDVLAVIES